MKTTNATSISTVLGNLGEALVADVLNCKISEDAYDSCKDMIDPAGRRIEVKTQKRFNDMLTIGANQLPKCKGVDVLIFVEYDNTDFIKIWRCNHRDKYTSYRTRFGKEMLGYKINDMILVSEVENRILAELMKHYSNDRDFKYYRMFQSFTSIN